MVGRAIAQAVIRRGGPGSNPGLVIWDFVMDKSGAGAGFLSENFGFPCTIYIPFASPQSSSGSPEAGRHNRPGLAAVPIASQTRIKKKMIMGTHCAENSQHALVASSTDSVCR
jgi:hypothetical protein